MSRLGKIRDEEAASVWRQSWMHKVGSVFLAAAWVCGILVAVSWAWSPSATMAQTLDRGWTFAWSAAFGVCCASALLARLTRRNFVEGVFSLFAGVLVWCWSLIIINLGYTIQPSSLQAGWALMVLAGLAVGWGFIETAWVTHRHRYEELLLEELTRRVRARAGTTTTER